MFFATSKHTSHILDFPLPEVRNHINDNPRQTPSKVDCLVCYEAHDAGGEDIILHICVPSEPQAFEVVEGYVRGGNGVELGPVCILAMEVSKSSSCSCVPSHCVSERVLLGCGGSRGKEITTRARDEVTMRARYFRKWEGHT